MMKTFSQLKFLSSLIVLPVLFTALAAANQAANDATTLVVNVPAPAKPLAVVAAERSHNLSIDSDGFVNGRIVKMSPSGDYGVGQLKVQFVRNGTIFGETVSEGDGSFRVNGLEPGVFTFVARGTEGLATFGVKVSAFDPNAPVDRLEAGLVTSEADRVFESFLDTSKPLVDFDEQSTVAGITSLNRVQLNSGSIKGNLHSLRPNAAIETTELLIVRDNQTVAQPEVALDGSFQVDGLSEGVYELVARGEAGFAALSFMATSESAPLANESLTGEAYAMVSQDVIPNSLDIVLGYEIIYITEYIETQDEPVFFTDGGVIGDTIGVGGFNGAATGGFAGGGGPLFGGGSGGLGRLLGAAGLVVGIIALADDGDGSGSPPSSPIIP